MIVFLSLLDESVLSVVANQSRKEIRKHRYSKLGSVKNGDCSMKVTKTRRKLWVISKSNGVEPIDHHSPLRSRILAICETKKEAEELRDRKFVGAYIDSAPVYVNPCSMR